MLELLRTRRRFLYETIITKVEEETPDEMEVAKKAT
jgi:hypothetical protein